MYIIILLSLNIYFILQYLIFILYTKTRLCVYDSLSVMSYGISSKSGISHE